MASVQFFSEKVVFKLPSQRKTANWLKKVIESEGCLQGEINFIFCSDSYLLKINKEYLNHNTLTDIITFDYSEGELIQGDIFISIHRVKENAKIFDVSVDSELHRVMVHGVLHLLGYKDKSASQKATMRRKEDAYLSLR
ncbi:MAG: rRNA maturation RNase YbeY [Cyclobacteriaceae bacterium]|nr:rRNA maturation RNase YbeY [Cyclobacteriaceae bacterium]